MRLSLVSRAYLVLLLAGYFNSTVCFQRGFGQPCQWCEGMYRSLPVQQLRREYWVHMRVTRAGEYPNISRKARIGVIVCDHGSRRPAANDMLFEVAERYRSFSKFSVVQPAHMELAEPTIEQAFERCVAAGAESVVCHPFFLSPGRHVTADIPALMEAAAKKHPGVGWVVSKPLGLQELMPQLMDAAVKDSILNGQWQTSGGSGADLASGSESPTLE